MPEGKKPAEDLYSAKTHLHQPVPEVSTVNATALPADAPEGALPSEVRPEIVTWEKLCEAIKASGKAYNMEMITKAYDLANKAHNGVCRRSGEPYICHPLAVARLVLDLGMDSESIAAALLHDVVEDTPTTLEDLTAAFGEEVALLVDGVTKLTKIQFSNIEELQAENLRKMLLAMSRDVRVMIIKLCDRLHNMRTGDAWPEQKRRDKARETMEVYAPIANRLGILNVKEELEDRSLHYLDPVGYEEISKMLSERAGEEFLARVSGVIELRLKESGIEGATIKRRVKSIYGIYRKTIMQNKSFDEIYDIYAVRVILDTLAECYSTLGLIHDMYHPLPNRFKDYISTPKPNGYQSLHTTVIGHEGIPFEVQIRTRKMDEQAEYGVAAHWKYKEGLDGHDKLDERLAWVSQLLENQRVSEDSGNLLHDLKSDLLPEEVFAFTPKGDVINLPTGATCIDFAYAIHSAVGNRMVGCKVNNRMVPIDHVVSTGEIIEVILGPADKGPSRDWLNIVTTSKARTKIRQAIKEIEARQTEFAKETIERKFKNRKLEYDEAVMMRLIKKLGYKTVTEFYQDIANETRDANDIIEKYLELKKKETENREDIVYRSAENFSMQTAQDDKTFKEDVLVIDQNLKGLDFKLAKCCNPIYGDDVFGFVTISGGIKIHRTDCPNARELQSRFAYRIVKARWAGKSHGKQYPITLRIVGHDDIGIVTNITSIINKENDILLRSISIDSHDGLFSGMMTVMVDDTSKLESLVKKIKTVKGVKQVNRG